MTCLLRICLITLSLGTWGSLSLIPTSILLPGKVSELCESTCSITVWCLHDITCLCSQLKDLDLRFDYIDSINKWILCRNIFYRSYFCRNSCVVNINTTPSFPVRSRSSILWLWFWFGIRYSIWGGGLPTASAIKRISCACFSLFSCNSWK